LRNEEWKNYMSKSVPNGSVMVVGAGIAGIQASLDLANSGYLVYLVEKNSAIGGVMSHAEGTSTSTFSPRPKSWK
jgi:heterodisulfide reductase subunit A-like polyferredoxin